MYVQVAEGEDVALRIGSWISGAYDDRLRVEVLSCSLMFVYGDG